MFTKFKLYPPVYPLNHSQQKNLESEGLKAIKAINAKNGQYFGLFYTNASLAGDFDITHSITILILWRINIQIPQPDFLVI